MRIKRSLKKLGVGWATSAVFSLMAWAGPQVKWENQRAEITAKPIQEEVTGQFRFKNTGDAELVLGSPRTSCGCTVATLEKTRYAPGEAGAVKAVFTIGGRLGMEEKVIAVETNDEKQPAAALILKVTIPAAVELSPTTLRWEKSEPLVAKKVRAVALAGTPIKQLSVQASDATLKVAVARVEGKTGEFEITVTPTATEKMVRGVVTVTTDWPAEKPKKFSIYVMVN